MPANARISELGALNVVLSQAGEQPVNGLVGIPRNASRALEVLREVTLQLQEDPSFWNWNTEKEQSLAPDAVTGKIQVASNVVSLSRAQGTRFMNQELTLRGDFIYNMTDSTYIFTAPVVVDLRVSLEWDEIPVQHRRFLNLLAAQQYQIRYIANPDKYTFDGQAVMVARAVAMGSETREASMSMLDNPELRQRNNRYY
jgi:hypothetical protein